MGVATKLPSARVDGGLVTFAEGMIVGVFDGTDDTISGVGDDVGEAIGGGAIVTGGGGDDGVKSLGKANNTTKTAMVAIASSPIENKKGFQL